MFPDSNPVSELFKACIAAGRARPDNERVWGGIAGADHLSALARCGRNRAHGELENTNMRDAIRTEKRAFFTAKDLR